MDRDTLSFMAVWIMACSIILLVMMMMITQYYNRGVMAAIIICLIIGGALYVAAEKSGRDARMQYAKAVKDGWQVYYNGRAVSGSSIVINGKNEDMYNLTFDKENKVVNILPAK